jgi:hypothetical protein
MTERDLRRAEFLDGAGWGGASATALPGDASFRRYFRLSDDGRQAMLMDAPPPQEDVRPFLRVARLLTGLGYSAPLIYACDVEAGFLVLEDLGDATYTRLIGAGEDELSLYALATDLLADLHDRYVPDPAHELPEYGDERLLFEAALLTDWFLPAATGAPTPPELREDYLATWAALLPLARGVPDSFVFRDYHIDNLMRLERPGLGACGLLDFQDAVIGPIAYDLVSLVEDARRDVPDAVRAAMLRRYLDRRPDIDAEALDTAMAVLGAQRHAKVIGIFCRLARRDGKRVYLHHLPRLWRLIERSLGHPALAPMEHWMNRNVPPDLRALPPEALA